MTDLRKRFEEDFLKAEQVLLNLAAEIKQQKNPALELIMSDIPEKYSKLTAYKEALDEWPEDVAECYLKSMYEGGYHCIPK